MTDDNCSATDMTEAERHREEVKNSEGRVLTNRPDWSALLARAFDR
ncbi:hypothetical protein [Halorussus caseinilyticus]|uniref:Uncharacterized protein n=1 Tax=Halorussus caseinilyticus TaxID=3034025 RepID=A0ABD5WQR4_9EURY